VAVRPHGNIGRILQFCEAEEIVKMVELVGKTPGRGRAAD
jgi:hypothetical protein